MKFDFSPLQKELDIWAEEGRVLPFWWRDDDAVQPTSALDQLSDLALTFDVAVHLAVIPEPATEALAQWTAGRSEICVVTHGFSHQNHAPAGVKKSEFGADRSIAAIRADLEQGAVRMAQIFGGGLAPMFVPPWNRISPQAVDQLVAFGYKAVSGFLPRKQSVTGEGVESINTHLDPIDWHGTRTLHDPDALIAKAVANLQDRRAGRTDANEPFGYLTHHLVHDAEIWAFSCGFLQVMTAGPIAKFSANALKGKDK